MTLKTFVLEYQMQMGYGKEYLPKNMVESTHAFWTEHGSTVEIYLILRKYGAYVGTYVVGWTHLFCGVS